MTQSNSLLLCKIGRLQKSSEEDREADACATVRSNVAEIWELAPVVPRTSTLPHLLKDSLYFGESEEGDLIDSGRRRYTPQNIASIVQASASELRQGIEEHHIILLDGMCSSSRISRITFLSRPLFLILQATIAWSRLLIYQKCCNSFLVI